MLALVPKPVGISPGQRYRIEQWAPHLRDEHGIDVDFAVFESPHLTQALYVEGKTFDKVKWMSFDALRRVKSVQRARQYDLAFVYRETSTIGPAVYEHLLHRMRVPFIYDFDDAIWLPGVGSRNPLFAKLRFPQKTASICRLATVVTVGNQYLADYARLHNSHVEIVPTTIDLSSYSVLPEPSQADELIVGWTGSFSTLTQLEHIRPALERLAARRKVAIRVICSEPPQRPFVGARNEFVRWTSAREAEDVASCHVGIMPLPDDAFARGKCACKALQFMATGRPVVVSPVGINAIVVRDGVNGYLADTQEDWVEKLEKLGADRALRHRLGHAGRAGVEQSFSARAAAAACARIARDVVTNQPRHR